MVSVLVCVINSVAVTPRRAVDKRLSTATVYPYQNVLGTEIILFIKQY